jgi:hypothetical protein
VTRSEPARHELPAIDAAALAAARGADLMLARARELGQDRWQRYLAPLPDQLRDAPLTGLRAAARRARSAYGPKDSIRDALPADVTEPFLALLDRLIRELNRYAARPDGDGQ